MGNSSHAFSTSAIVLDSTQWPRCGAPGNVSTVDQKYTRRDDNCLEQRCGINNTGFSVVLRAGNKLRDLKNENKSHTRGFRIRPGVDPQRRNDPATIPPAHYNQEKGFCIKDPCSDSVVLSKEKPWSLSILSNSLISYFILILKIIEKRKAICCRKCIGSQIMV